ncbi:hypothetical protein THRCLA_20909 [Thraustotheca clavata]|uniref:Uncharacterized protein n=1 Tax=Thraustotheca clavata TaxID=74557 RepID=A0A1W0A267_9STRA|nr:hypothetical protein THRCLA_20909 [Thraustotheca clavata]
MSIDAPYLRQTLLEAAQESDLEAIMNTLENGSSIENLINSVDTATGFTALHHACSNGNVEITCFLLRHGAPINVCDHVVYVLLDAGVLDLKDFYNQNKAKLTCLQTAAAKGYTAILNLLLLHGDVIDGVNDLGETALHHAAAGNFLEAAQLLVHCGANLMATTPIGDTPLHYACQNNAINTAIFIVDCGMNTPPRSCLEMARVFGHATLANAILQVALLY